MTELEWLSAAEPRPMVLHLGERASHRKLRLFVFACVRRHWHLLRDERLRRAVETSELHADGRVDDGELGRAVTEANRARRKGSPVGRAAYDAARYKPSEGVHWDSVSMYCAYAAANSAVPDVPPSAYSYCDGGKVITVEVPVDRRRARWNETVKTEYAAQCDLLRDIVGNPFRPSNLDPRWLTQDVVELARVVYEDRTFDKLPELGDHLTRAGCEDPAILGHCRSPAPHVRGCWVVDWILGNG